LVLELSEDASEYRVVGTAEEVLPETLAQNTKEKILLALRVLESATVDEIAEYLQEHREHIPKRTIHHHLAQLYTEGAVNREGRGTRAEPYTYSCNRAIVQPLNTLHDCTNSEHSGNRAIGQSLNTLPDCQLREAAQVDASTLFTLAAERGYPALVVEYPDGKARFHIAGTREGWELALPYLERENLMQAAYHALCDSASVPPAEPLPAMPNLFVNRTPLVWDLIDDWLQSASNPEDPYGLEPEELDAVRVMLAYAEARGFPSLEVDGYRIHGDMAGWLTAAQQLAGTPAIALATRLLHALDASGTPHAPTHNTLLRNGDASLTPSQLSLEEV
jgi:DNA-binding transcriptional ArsR family regulator